MRTFNLIWSIAFLAILSLTLQAQEPFNGQFVMNMKTYEDNGSTPQNTKMQCFVKDGKVLMEYLKIPGMDKEQYKNMSVLMHPEEEETFVLMDQGGQKMAIKSEFDPEDFEELQEEQNPEVNVTDQTKTIEGYNCKKVIVINEDRKTEAWVTEEVAFTNNKIFQYNESSPIYKGESSTEPVPIEGWTLRSTNYDKESGEKLSSLSIKNIQKKEVSDDKFDMSEYRVMEMELDEMFGD